MTYEYEPVNDGIHEPHYSVFIRHLPQNAHSVEWKERICAAPNEDMAITLTDAYNSASTSLEISVGTAILLDMARAWKPASALGFVDEYLARRETGTTKL